jgi:hypothetical protein
VRYLTNGNAGQRRKNRREQERIYPAPEELQPPERNHATDDKGVRKEKEENQINMLKKLFGSSTLWSLVFTGLLTIFTFLLYLVTKDSLRTSKEQAKAIVTFGGFGIGPAMADTTTGAWSSQQFQITWTNSGTLPGKSAIFQQNEEPFYSDLPSGFDFPVGSDKTQGIVGPKGSYTATLTIPRSQLEDNWHGKARIFVWGAAVYKDGFNDDPVRVSEFCTEIYQVTVGYVTPPAQPKTVKPVPTPPPAIGAPNTAIVGMSWRSCPRGVHSCYDEDCSDYNERIKDITK